jgi:hypothetical protein
VGSACNYLAYFFGFAIATFLATAYSGLFSNQTGGGWLNDNRGLIAWDRSSVIYLTAAYLIFSEFLVTMALNIKL